jgi:hypothetical protein
MLCNTVTKIEATIQNDVTHPNMADRKEKRLGAGLFVILRQASRQFSTF